MSNDIDPDDPIVKDAIRDLTAKRNIDLIIIDVEQSSSIVTTNPSISLSYKSKGVYGKSHSTERTWDIVVKNDDLIIDGHSFNQLRKDLKIY